MNNCRHVEHPSRVDLTEKLREPEHQAGTSDGKHAPEDRQKIELFPVGPALKGGFRPFEKEPPYHGCYVFDIPLVGTQGVGTEQSLHPVPRYVLSEEKKMDAHGIGRKEVNKRNDGAYPVNQGGVGRSAEKRHEKL